MPPKYHEVARFEPTSRSPSNTEDIELSGDDEEDAFKLLEIQNETEHNTKSSPLL